MMTHLSPVTVRAKRTIIPSSRLTDSNNSATPELRSHTRTLGAGFGISPHSYTLISACPHLYLHTCTHICLLALVSVRSRSFAVRDFVVRFFTLVHHIWFVCIHSHHLHLLLCIRTR